jgi:hypothetical protein
MVLRTVLVQRMMILHQWCAFLKQGGRSFFAKVLCTPLEIPAKDFIISTQLKGVLMHDVPISFDT